MKKHLQHLFHPQRSNNHRPELLKPVVLFLLSLASICGLIFSKEINTYIHSPPGFVLGTTSDITADEIIAFTNVQREKQGLNTISANEKLNTAAMAKAQDMFAKQYWAHISPQGKQPWAFITESNYSYLVAGENLARDFQHADEVVEAWMASPTHKANLLHHRYTEIGVAVLEGELEGMQTTLVVQMFGTPNVPQTAAEEPSVTVIQPGVVTEQASTITNTEPSVLAGQSIRTTSLQDSIIISPMAVMKAVFLAILLLIITTLLYDFVIVSHTQVVRVVGKNMAHVFLFLTVIYLLLYYKGGFIL